MTPLRLTQTGEYDAAFEVVLEADGRFSIERGGYVTGGRHYGTLAPGRVRALERLVAAVDLEGEHVLEGAVRSRLEVRGRVLEWAGPPPTPALRALASALARL